MRPIAWQTTGAYLATVATTVAALVVPIVIGAIIDSATGATQNAFAFLPGSASPRGQLLGGAGLLVMIGLLRSGLSFVQRYGTAWVGRMVATDLRGALFAHLMRLETAFHDRASVGQLMTRLTSDTEQVRQFAATAAADIFNIFALLIGAAVILTAQDAGLAVVALAPMSIVAVLALVGARQLRPLFLKLQSIRGGLSARLQETLAQVRVVQAFVAEDRTQQRYAEANEELYESRLAVARVFTTVFPGMNAVLGVGTAAVLLLGGQRVLDGSLSVGSLVVFMSYIGLIGQPVRRLGFLLNLASRASASATRIFELLDREPTLNDPEGPAEKLPSGGGAAEWDHVTFAYEDVAVLHDVNIAVSPGEHIAIVGASGSGKTTLVQLLVRLYDPSQGRALVDHTDVRELSGDTLRAKVGYVEQEAFLFSATVAENIRFSDPHAGDEDVRTAARIAGADDFIRDLPDGYDTLVGERGVTLSGGQRQRVALARTLLGRPEVLIMDDAVSAVDARTEQRMRTALAENTGDQTVISVAQRLSTILAADRIVVLAGGRVVQKGRHEELAQQAGPYADMLRISRSVSGDVLLEDQVSA